MRRFYLQLDLTFPAPYRAFFMGEAGPEALFDQFESLQRLLPEKGFVVGEWSLADVALVPVLLRFEVMIANEIGKYAVGEGKRTLEILKSPRFARLARYLEEAKAWPSVKATWNEVRSCTTFGIARDADLYTLRLKLLSCWETLPSSSGTRLGGGPVLHLRPKCHDCLCEFHVVLPSSAAESRMLRQSNANDDRGHACSNA